MLTVRVITFTRQISFPYPDQGTACPRLCNVTVILTEARTYKWTNVLGIWRRVPKYLNRGRGGHLFVFPNMKEDVLDQWISFDYFEVLAVSEPLKGHELCKMKICLS